MMMLDTKREAIMNIVAGQDLDYSHSSNPQILNLTQIFTQDSVLLDLSHIFSKMQKGLSKLDKSISLDTQVFTNPNIILKGLDSNLR
jgi:hypothetical protein